MTAAPFRNQDMNDKTDASRRQLLKMLAGAPLLPLGAASLGLFGAPGSAFGKPRPRTFTTAEFIGMPAPTLANPAAMATTTVGSGLKVSFSDGRSQTYKLAYQPFFLTGDKVPDGKGGT